MRVHDVRNCRGVRVYSEPARPLVTYSVDVGAAGRAWYRGHRKKEDRHINTYERSSTWLSRSLVGCAWAAATGRGLQRSRKNLAGMHDRTCSTRHAAHSLALLTLSHSWGSGAAQRCAPSALCEIRACTQCWTRSSAALPDGETLGCQAIRGNFPEKYSKRQG